MASEFKTNKGMAGPEMNFSGPATADFTNR